MRPSARLFLVAALAAGVMTPAGAMHCNSYIFIHSNTAGVIGPPLGIMCLLDPGSHDVDWRLINPLSETVLVQYLLDQGPSTPVLQGILGGLGFENTPVTLTRTETAGNYSYLSPILEVPDGRTASGCLTAAVWVVPDDPEVPPETNSFHTLDSSCPDF